MSYLPRFCKTLCKPAPQPGVPITKGEVRSHSLKFLVSKYCMCPVLNIYIVKEANTESMDQVVLNISILMISGLQEKVFLFPGDLQLFSLSISILMIIKSAGTLLYILFILCICYYFRRAALFPEIPTLSC